MVNAQEYLDKNYPKDQRKIITELDISNKNLEGVLDLSDFVNLEELHCGNNQLTNLILTSLKIRKIFGSGNKLEKLDFLKNLSPIRLVTLRINENKFPPQDLSCFTSFYNLQRLFISNNSFYGSLKPLRNLSKLQELNINNTDVDGGLEYLPKNFFEDFLGINALASTFGMTGGYFARRLIVKENGNLAKQLEKYRIENDSLKTHDFQAWRKDNDKMISNSIREESQNLQIQDESSIKLNKQIGNGSYGQVYKATWHGQTVAVKKIPAIYLSDIDKEIKALKRLNHDNIIEYYGEKSKDNNVYLIMEYAEQRSLNRWIEKNENNPHDWQLNYRFIDQITKGLVYLHSENIIHRDLKSHNILITKDNVAKIADFGLAKIIDDSLASSGRKTKGSIRWMAPEVLKTGKHSFKSDTYSLGMIMWEIVAKNTKPFSQLSNNNAVMYNFCNDNLKEIIPTDTPEELKKIIELCWQEEPSERINLIDIESQLDELIHEAVIEVI
jgi:tRNA A-37 threonylcarbamoyl transferase component Bud32